MWFGPRIVKENFWKACRSLCLEEWLLFEMQRDGHSILSIDFLSLKF